MKGILDFVLNVISGIIEIAVVLSIIGLPIFVLGSCSDRESQRIESIASEAREEGYRQGYDAGYERGASDQREKDREDLLMDGRSIRDISNAVERVYGITPRQAFDIYDDGGYSWSDLKKAKEAIYYTASLFPFGY